MYYIIQIPKWREHYQYCISTITTVLFNIFQYFSRVLGDLAGAQIPWVPVGVVCWCEVRSADESCRTCPVTFTRAQSLNSSDFAGRSRNRPKLSSIVSFQPQHLSDSPTGLHLASCQDSVAFRCIFVSQWSSREVECGHQGPSFGVLYEGSFGHSSLTVSIFIYFHLFSIFKILQVYDSLCTKHASKWSATTGHWWLLHVCSKGRKVQSKRGQSEIPLKKSHVSLEMTTYFVIILHEHALTSSILIQQKPRPLLLPAAGMILNLSRLMNN